MASSVLGVVSVDRNVRRVIMKARNDIVEHGSTVPVSDGNYFR